MSRPDDGVIRSRHIVAGLEVVETSKLKTGFAPHRHDSYVIGVTCHGVQSFRYRGQHHHALPGQAFVLHPDETHDGGPGTPDGYGYRAIYVAPRLVANATLSGELPFVGDAALTDTSLVRAIVDLFEDWPHQLLEIAVVSLLSGLARELERLTRRPSHRGPVPLDAMRQVKARLDAAPRSNFSMSDLEAEHGLSRFTITRCFRRCFGVSPLRYVLMRRLEDVRRRIVAGERLADAAVATGFSDQSHMTRQFLRTYGMTPGRWKALHQNA